MPSLSSLLVFLLASFTAASPTSKTRRDRGPVVTVLNGTYEGNHLSVARQDEFLGIPYAKPPVGNFRFRGPRSLQDTWSGLRSATEYGDVCMQYVADPGFPMSEDCLTLNVIRPSGSYENKTLPVAVWIHGGGLYSGSGRGTNLTNFVTQSVASKNPLIAVSINYRLSAFGFLWGSDELERQGSANNGLRDQRMALAWIQDNIAGFGGDPDRVTIFGQSAGGLSVGKHLIAYGGRDDGLFRAAIMQSGGMAEKWPYNIREPDAYTRDLYRNLTTTTACSNDDSSLECLRALPVESLSRALNVSDTPVFSGTGLGPWLIQVDGDFLQDGPTESLDKGHFNPLPIMYTTNTDEATVFMYVSSVDDDNDFRAFVAAGGPDNKTITAIEALYPRDPAAGLPAGWVPTAEETETYGRQWKRAVAFQTDAVETCSRRKTVDVWAAAGGTAYSARIDILPPTSSPSLGSHHSQELPYVFDTLGDDSNKQLVFMAKLMSRTWASFVTHLDPNHHGLCGVPIWPVRSEGVGSNFVFNTDGTASAKSFVEADDFRLRQTNYLSSIMQEQMYY